MRCTHHEASHDLLYTAAWCAKESLAKATGVGLGSPKRWRAEKVSLTHDEDPREPHGEVWVGGHAVTWWVMSLDQQGAYVIAALSLPADYPPTDDS